jgi:hypothetical protein
MDTSIEAIAARLLAVEDRLAIIELEGAYARAFDSRDGAAWAALFVPDGIYQARGATPEKGNFVRGHDALADFCANAPFDGIHLMHVPQVRIDGDTAQSRIHLEFVGLFHAPGNPSVRMVGYYDVRYARVDGVWRIVHRVTSTMTRVDTVGHPYPQGTGFDA